MEKQEKTEKPDSADTAVRLERIKSTQDKDELLFAAEYDESSMVRFLAAKRLEACGGDPW